MQKPIQCQFCNLNKLSQGFSLPEGKGNYGVTLIGDWLSDHDRIEALPFRPKSSAGSLLERAFGDLGVTRQGFNITNLLQCQPFYEIKEDQTNLWNIISCCTKNYGQERLDRFDHNVFVSFGPVSFTALTNYSGVKDEKTSLSYIRGYAVPMRVLGGQESDKIIIPTYHPNYIIRGNWEYYEYLKRDLQYALDLAKGKYQDPRKIPPPEYNITPCLEDVWSYYRFLEANPNLLVTYDIETPMLGGLDENQRDEVFRTNLEIIQIQFSHQKKFGIVFHCKDEYREVAKKILALPNPKANHNTWNFDNKILKAQGFNIAGRVDDTMWMFKHWYPGLELHLQSVAGMCGFRIPWKHMFGENMDWYGACDVDAVQYVMSWLPKRLQQAGIWNGYDRHVRELYVGVLSKGVGVPVDEEEYKKLLDWIETKITKLNKKAQKMFPDFLKPIKQKQGLKKTPKEILPYIEFYNQNTEEINASRRINGKPEISLAEFVQIKTGYVQREFELLNEFGEVHKVIRWAKLQEFKTSSKQVKDYVSWQQSLCRTQKAKALWKLPKNLKTKKETTGKDAIDEIVERTGDEFLGIVKEIRSLVKMLKNDMKHWNPNRGENLESIKEIEERTKKMIEAYEEDEVAF